MYKKRQFTSVDLTVTSKMLNVVKAFKAHCFLGVYFALGHFKKKVFILIDRFIQTISCAALIIMKIYIN